RWVVSSDNLIRVFKFSVVERKKSNMAASLVDAAVGRFGAMLVDQKTKETSIFIIFRKRFEWLKRKLFIVSMYLKDADVQSVHNNSVEQWLLDAADIAWDAEDILQQCAVESLYTNNDGNTQSSRVIFRYKMGRRIKDIRERMKSVMEDAAELKLVADLTHSEQPSTSASQNVKWKKASVLERDARPVAIEPKVEEIFGLIDDPEVPVIAVVGMGGIGKTFLMQNVFNRIKDRFEYSIWLSISQTYSLQRLQADLAAKINFKEVVNGRISEVQAAEFIHSRLESKRSLIVLDDVWRATAEDDLISKLGIPTGRCKIVVTTRNVDDIRKIKARVYDMKPLSEEDSWMLFCAFAFPDCEQNRLPPHLEQIAHQIVKEGGGMPLAVKTVAASLADKASLKVWESKLSELREVDNRHDPVMEILRLSYDSLPLYVKPIFTFLSFFPADEVIDCEYMINLWIGEGLTSRGEDQWETGFAYLQILHDRCLVKVEENSHSKIYCQVDGMILDLAISLSTKTKCVFATEKAFANSTGKTTNYRRILLANSCIDDNTIVNNSVGSPEFVRTLTLYRNKIDTIPAKFFARMNVLRTLDLSSTNISTLPESVGNLKLLRVLSLCCTQIKEVPNCVRNVTRLCFLDLSRCRFLQRLPAWIGELKCLEHLNVVGCSPELASCMPAGISKLLSLRILRSDYLNFSIQENKFLKLEHLARLTQLQELSINVNHDMELKGLEEGVLEQLVKMRSLAIANEIPPVEVADSLKFPHFPDIMESMNDLEKLFLCNFSVPNWVTDNFKKLRIIEISGSCSDYPDLENLPCLERLNLLDNNNATELPRGFGKAGGFPNLRFLEISDFPLLKELPDLEEEAMQSLEKLCIHSCKGLKKFPEGLERVKNLRKIEVYEGSNEIVESLHGGGQYWAKLKASIPSLNISVNQ
ncbi:hypothetical protein KI387_042936, partial [Taxus chinensis]